MLDKGEGVKYTLDMETTHMTWKIYKNGDKEPRMTVDATDEKDALRVFGNSVGLILTNAYRAYPANSGEATTRHRKGLYCCDCSCPECEQQRKAILLGSNPALAATPANKIA
jgi:hypothetical protein